MNLMTDPGYIHCRCNYCGEIVKIPAFIEAILLENESGTNRPLTARVGGIDMQPFYDHYLNEHGPKL